MVQMKQRVRMTTESFFNVSLNDYRLLISTMWLESSFQAAIARGNADLLNAFVWPNTRVCALRKRRDGRERGCVSTASDFVQ